MVVRKSEVPNLTPLQEQQVQKLERLIDSNLRSGIAKIRLDGLYDEKVKEKISEMYKTEGDWEEVEFRITTSCRDESVDHWIILQ